MKGVCSMRRKDREVTDFETVRTIIDQCEVIRLGLSDPTDPLYPYIVPLNFGYTAESQDEIHFFVHGAKAGRKFQLMQSVGRCSFQMECDTVVELVPQSRDVTTRYKCLMGKAEITLLDGDNAIRALDLIMSRREDTGSFNWNRTAASHTAVWDLKVTEWTAKVNRPKNESKE